MPPTSAILTNAAVVQPGIPQHGTFWCIPASIENMLHCVGCTNLSQEDLVEAFIRTQMSGGSVQASRQTVLEHFRSRPLPGAHFGSFTSIVERKLAGSLPSRELSHEGNLTTADYLLKIKTHIANDEPVLISARSGGNLCHITVVFGYNGDVINTYDPGQDLMLDLHVSNYTFEQDMLILKTTPDAGANP